MSTNILIMIALVLVIIVVSTFFMITVKNKGKSSTEEEWINLTKAVLISSIIVIITLGIILTVKYLPL